MIASRREEAAFLFDAGGEQLVGIVTTPAAGPDDATPSARLGVLIVVGGPQYRVGSHRQFVLLARALAARGYAVMRFDCAGMGDSSGAERPFTDRGNDIAAAIDAFVAQVPTIAEVAIWGLCDAASAALMYAPDDPRVTRLVLLNPWVRSDAGLARTHLKHYYGSRLTDRAFWGSLLRGRVGVLRALKDFVSTMIAARRPVAGPDDGLDFQARMARGWKRFGGDILLICSGADLTAREFIDHAATDAAWSGAVDGARVARCTLADADHTFSRAEWRDRVAEVTADWLDERGAPAETASSGNDAGAARKEAPMKAGA
ncbi:MAG: hydrolase 1, exosortase A system-associated [Burkholderiaceae bacterium]